MKLNVLVACELLNSPLQSIVLGHIDCAPGWSIETWTLNVLRHWHVDVHVVRDALLFVVAFHLYNEPDLSIGRVLNNYVNCE